MVWCVFFPWKRPLRTLWNRMVICEFWKNGFLMDLVTLLIASLFPSVEVHGKNHTKSKPLKKTLFRWLVSKVAWIWAMNTTMMDWLLFPQRKTAPQKCSVHFHFVVWMWSHFGTKSTSTLFETFASQNVGVFNGKSAHQAGWIFTTFQNVFLLRVCNPRLLFYSFGVIICQTVTDHCRYAATGADVPACEPDLLRCFGRKGHGCKPPLLGGSSPSISHLGHLEWA